ncbi:MAG: DUF4349 domain-containing protein [Micropepsaceae bacterium]
MNRLHIVTFCSILALAACDNRQSEESAPAPATEASAPMQPPSAQFMVAGGVATDAVTGDKGATATRQSGESYVYDHNLTVSMASEFIKVRFERARDKCQNDLALKCKVTGASYQVLGEPDAPLPVANLRVALPHESVDAFINTMMETLPGEGKHDLVIKSRTTTAENVTNQVRDIESRLSQLRNYRDRMEELSKRRNAGTDDLIKIEGEISRTQAEIEQIEGQRRDLADRIAKENLAISFQAQSTASDAFQPVREVWQGSLRLLGESAASAIALVVGIIPWIPVFLAGFFGIRFIWRRTRKS